MYLRFNKSTAGHVRSEMLQGLMRERKKKSHSRMTEKNIPDDKN